MALIGLLKDNYLYSKIYCILIMLKIEKNRYIQNVPNLILHNSSHYFS